MYLNFLPEVVALRSRHAPSGQGLELRDALMLVACVASNYLPAGREPDRLSWLPQGWLVGRAIGQRRALRSALSLKDMTLLLLDHETPIASLPLIGLSLEEALIWLEKMLAESLPKGYARPLRRWEKAPAFNPPLFSILPERLAELSIWFSRAQFLFEELSRQAGSSPIRCNPSGGDLSFHQQLPELSLEIGFSVGDGAYRTPYFYITPWPVPPQAAEIAAALPLGHWHNQGWKGAVVTLNQLSGVAEKPSEQVRELRKFFLKVRQDLYDASIGKWRLLG